MSLRNLLKSVVAAALVTACMLVPAFGAGTLPIAMAQQIDINGQPLAACQVNFFVAGTPNSPQDSFADFGLTQKNPGTLVCDQAGRVPMFWLADGLVHVRLIDATGDTQIDTTMQVLGPSSGGGGGGSTVDPTAIAATGDVKFRIDKTPLTGWVRINGLTIGNATSGATERANADAQNLFVYIWTNFSQPSGNLICPVVGGIGANALADFNANKQITLEDMRGRSLFGLDDMGNSPAGRFAGITFGVGDAVTGGSRAGSNTATLTLAQLPPITSSASNSISVSGTTTVSGTVNVSGTVTVSSARNIPSTSGAIGSYPGPSTGGSWTPTSGALNDWSAINSMTGSNSMSGANSLSGSNTMTGSNTISVTSTNTLGQSVQTLPVAVLGTLFWKL